KSPYWEQNFGIGAIDGTPQDLDIDTIIIRVIPDETSALLEFKSGKLDILSLTDFPSERKQMQNDPRFEIYASLKDIVTVLAFNLRRYYIGGDNNYWFLNKQGKEAYTKGAAIRKGICYAVDRNKINNDFYNGERIIADSPIAPSQTYWYYQNITKYEYNLTKASYWINLAGKPIVPPPPPDANAMSMQWSLGVLVFCLVTYKFLKKIKKWHS
ncbi:MAG: ABC transporter substrate-binding protein, partial [Candidatus Heimdallarchaeaceae archaeon]